MKRSLQVITFVVFAAHTFVLAQTDAAQRVLGEIRMALGGDAKIAAVRSIAVEGRKTNSTADGTSPAEDFEMAIELSGTNTKFVKKEVIANLGGTVIGRRSGFNGADVIEEVDAPPAMGGGGMRIMRMSPGGAMPGGHATPEQLAEQRAQLMVTNRREFARLALGMFGNTTAAYPVEFVYAGQAEAPDGKADVLEVKGPDGFSGKLFVDGKTHLPLMLMWMDKEPLRMMSTMGGAAPVAGRGNVQVFSGSGGGRGQSPEDIAKMQEDMAARMKEAEANRKTVEYRVIYADYKSFDGVRLPTRIQRMTDGLPTEELTLEKIKINSKIDASKFAVVK